MKKAIKISLLLVALSLNIKAQTNTTKNVGIGTLNPDPSAILDLDVSNAEYITKLGFLVPRMTAEQRDAIVNPATSLIVYVTDDAEGFYYYDGAGWRPFSSSIDFGDKASFGILHYDEAKLRILSSEKLTYNVPNNTVKLTGTSVDLKSLADGEPQGIKFFAKEGSDKSVKVISPEELTEDITFELPKNNPAEGQVLTRTANGTEWATPNVVPIGTILPFAGTVAPEGWMIANGDELNVAEYQALYNVIGNSYGGDATNFNLPNLVGRFPLGLDRGPDAQVGQDGGNASITLVAENIPAHQHTVIARGATADQVDPRTYENALINYSGDEKPPIMTTAVIYGHPQNMNYNESFELHSTTIQGPEGDATPISTMPPYLKILYIIRVK